MIFRAPANLRSRPSPVLDPRRWIPGVRITSTTARRITQTGARRTVRIRPL